MKLLRNQTSILVGGSSIHCIGLAFSSPIEKFIVTKQRASVAYRKKPFSQQLRDQFT